MSPWLLEFKRNYPGIVLDVLFENSVEDLLREEVDIAVRITSEPPEHLVARELGKVHYVACASPAYAARRGLPQRRSEEHTSELQSLMRTSYAVFCLKKKINMHNTSTWKHTYYTE